MKYKGYTPFRCYSMTRWEASEMIKRLKRNPQARQERKKRIAIYCERAEKKLPLFEDKR